MPCFKGLAVSIHTPDGPIGEHSIQKQVRAGRITSYIPVPKPRISSHGTAEQSTFAISITLLTPGLSVPYSTPKSTPENPYPRAQIVGHAPRAGDRTGQAAAVTPYQPLTASDNETIAAYIYFDGRTKEEVATLLRRGEETWVNSRWVGVPESEGGGLAEREFLFKEVGLERWLNGLDLAGSKDAAEKVQRRKERLEKKRQKTKSKKDEDDEDDDDFDPTNPGKSKRPKSQSVLRYGDGDAPLEKLSDEDQSSDESDPEDDEDPLPESAGQIKVALFRVLASGEIKKGEYSPQFDAHDDDEDAMRDGDGDNGEEIDHATSFAKPKTLDPKSISTQTVTGIDPPDKPYAVFTFLYRGEKQLQKMGILKPKKAPVTERDAKRKSVQETVKGLSALKAGAAERFSNFRDSNGKKKGDDDDMSDDDDDEKTAKAKADKETAEEDDGAPQKLNPKDAQRQENLASGIQKIRLKRQHSFEPPSLTPDPSMLGSEHPSPTKETSETTPPTTSGADLSSTPLLPGTTYSPLTELKAESSIDKAMIGSPMKKARASLSAEEDTVRRERAEALAKGLGFGFGADNQLGDFSSNGGVAATGIFGGNIKPTGNTKESSGPSATHTTAQGASTGTAGQQPAGNDASMDEEL